MYRCELCREVVPGKQPELKAKIRVPGAANLCERKVCPSCHHPILFAKDDAERDAAVATRLRIGAARESQERREFLARHNRPSLSAQAAAVHSESIKTFGVADAFAPLAGPSHSPWTSPKERPTR